MHIVKNSHVGFDGVLGILLEEGSICFRVVVVGSQLMFDATEGFANTFQSHRRSAGRDEHLLVRRDIAISQNWIEKFFHRFGRMIFRRVLDQLTAISKAAVRIDDVQHGYRLIFRSTSQGQRLLVIGVMVFRWDSDKNAAYYLKFSFHLFLRSALRRTSSLELHIDCGRDRTCVGAVVLTRTRTGKVLSPAVRMFFYRATAYVRSPLVNFFENLDSHTRRKTLRQLR